MVKKKETIKIIQMTDTHLSKDGTCYFNVNTNETFEKVIRQIKEELNDTDAIFLTGDLSQDESKESYQLITDAFGSLNKNVFWIPGNHDALSTMEYVFYQKKNFFKGKTLSISHWDFIFLNTKLEGTDEGLLSDGELVFLMSELKKERKNSLALIMHHHPIKVKTPLIDKYMLKNNDVFLDMIHPYKVDLIMCGHVHNDYSLNYGNITIETAPASCFQFNKAAVKLDINYRIGYKVYYFSKDDYVSEAKYWNH